MLDSGADNRVRVKVIDAAGNESTSETTFFLPSEEGAPTVGAPGTPVFNDIYQIGSKLTRTFDPAEDFELVESDDGDPEKRSVLYVDRSIPKGLQVVVGGTSGLTVDSTEQIETGEYEVVVRAELTERIAESTTVAWLQNWQMAFDKTTQTVWFNSEGGNMLAQFDPSDRAAEDV